MSRLTKIRITVEEVRNAIEEELGKAPRGVRSEMMSADISLENAMFWIRSVEKRLSEASLLD